MKFSGRTLGVGYRYMESKIEYIRLNDNQLDEFRQLMALFGREFEDLESYDAKKPSDNYASEILAKNHIVHLVARDNNVVVGGLVAYILEKFEQERSECYIYDLAVASSHRRQGIATQLIQNLKPIAKESKASVIFVQADYGDTPAIKLYESLGVKEDVLHFDIKT